MIPGSADPKSSQAQPSWVVGPSIPAASRLGQVIEGEFLIKGVLGQGELGVTYEAENARLKRKFAVLMLKRELKPTHEMMLAVRNDLRRAQQLGAAGLMPVKMLADREGIPGFATELLEGETLRARLNRSPLRAERALAIVLSIARTLDAAHKVGLVHGDLRPENIFLVRPGAKNSSAGKVMVVEHAMHHLRRRAAGLDDRLPLYKHLYRPPEQVAGMIGATEKGDVFVLGAILHECLTARPAFFAEEIEFILENLASPPPPLQPNAATGLSAPLAEALTLLIRHACALQLDERVPSMSELMEGLEQIVQGYGLKLPEPPVEAKDEVTIAARPATAASENMSRLLQRMSGVFPQISLPAPTAAPVPVAPTGEPSSAGSAEASQSGPAAAVRISGDAGASLPRLEPLQQERVSRILRKLSGAFPVIAPPPPDADEPGAAPVAASPPVAAAAVEAPAPSVLLSAAPASAGREPIDSVAAPSATTPVLAALPAVEAPRPAASYAPAATPDSVPTDPKAALPVLPDLVPSPLPPVSSPVGPLRPVPEPFPRGLAAPAAPALPSPDLSATTAAGTSDARPGGAEPAPASAQILPSLPAADELSGIRRAAAMGPGVPFVPSAILPRDPTGPDKRLLEVGAAPQPTTAPIVPAAPELDTSPEDASGLAAVPLPPLPLPPTLVVANPTLPERAEESQPPAIPTVPAEIPTRPRLEVSTELAVPPLALGVPAPLLPAPVVLLPPAPAGLSALPGTGSPFQSGAMPAVPSPLSSAPTAVQIPRPGRLQHETTLAGDDLAVILEPSLPALPVPSLPPPTPAAVVPPTPKPQDAPALVSADRGEPAGRVESADLGAMRTVAQLPAVPNTAAEQAAPGAFDGAAAGPPRTISDLSTRPALAALAEKLIPLPPPLQINELPTQPAVRRLPITELATQARIPSAGNSAAEGSDPVQAALADDAVAAAALALSSSGPTASPTSATLSPQPASGPVTPVPQAGPIAAGAATAAPLQPPPPIPARVSPAFDPPAEPSAITAPERASPPRPPRVSQLIAALQNQQGPLRPPPEPEAIPAPAPSISSSGPKSTGAQARGLMPPAPEALSVLPTGDAQSLASLSQPAVMPMAPASMAPQPQNAVERWVDWALRHQELAAAGLGALLVLLVTLFYLALVR